ncbi:PD-(D/E)XK nuclease superfamily protein [Halanaerobium saccharolyticum]|uniref:PD-(D/E)XK nuclease superfamily protein n=1 Tax=Halanaerobium saccharolyticum TaxID=43595 RepID=A0A4R7Z9B1_9FIRM|nr:AAA family ATPase [Halanaerobium saccharolyticum]RAK11730.1 PD-(D/E)XK nuclease superfamily protein [Halanaerobium saccharolyticum]TDW07571.1 PD-(D/E)XK nuclease superfamily protein [Halanaerobium saccharolyticum]TDX64492.1 PD-(D/E)XK nuclease superfamily protein [Halanaerobium saccharolyticum]
MARIPYGVSSFSRLQKDNYIYIDKTKYIETLESYGEPYIFFLRPRRFGKTLFLSTLENYYDIQEKENFDRLFGDLYIGQNTTELANNYYILKFDFSGVTTNSKSEMKRLFAQKVKKGIKSFVDKYDFDINISESEEAAGIIHDFNMEIANKIRHQERKIYLLIDEYDHFANDILGKDPDEFQEIVGQTGSIRIFFEAIKEATADGIISRIFVTGVSPITLDSMTSGFNIAKNKTMDSNLNTMMGFTEKEARYLIKETMPGYDFDSMLQRLKEYYDGYLFTHRANERVFNTDMLLYYVSEYLIDNTEPSELIDSNISSDYSKLQNLFSLKDRKQNYEILEDILAGNDQRGKVTVEFNLQRRFSKKDFLSLLFYLGFLTIAREEDGFIYFRVPNYAVKEIYFDYFNSIISEETLFDSLEIEASVVEILKNGDIKPFIEKVEATLAALSNRDYIKFDEKYIKILIFSYLNLTQLSIVKSEYEVEEGYLDLALLRRNKKKGNFDALIELKYIKAADYREKGEALVEQKLNEASEQLERYGRAAEFKDRKDLKKWALVFTGTDAAAVKVIK